MLKPPQKLLEWIAKHFENDSSKMLITTGVLGWALSSTAQIGGILFNKNISDKEKSFLLPQEFMDTIANIGLFLIFTLSTKKLVSKLFTTGKWTTKNVRMFINENENMFKNKIGKLDFNIDDVLAKTSPALKQEHTVAKNLGTTLATVGAGIIASNIVTPFIRNKSASKAQKKYIDYKANTPYPSGGMKI